jgi:hypothetical protein
VQGTAAKIRTFALGQEGIEAQDELVVPTEQILDALNHAGSVDPI